MKDLTISQAAALLGSARTPRKSQAARENGKRGGYWKQTRNKDKTPPKESLTKPQDSPCDSA